MAPANSVIQKPSASEDEILGLPKWVWGAIAGGVITVGLAYYIFAGDEDKKKKPKNKKKPIPANTANKSAKVSSAQSTPSKSKVTVEDAPEEDDIEKVRLFGILEY